MTARPEIKKYGVCLFMVFCFFANPGKSQEGSVQPQGIYSSDFVIDGIPRTITFYIPFGYGKFDTYPVVLFLHPEGETGKSVLKKYNDVIQPLADSSACIVVYPDAFKGHWNTKLGEHAANDTINDPGFLNILIDYFVQQYHADPGRVYAVGFYGGGEMAWRLSCSSSKVVAVSPFLSSVQAAVKGCTPGIHLDAKKYMPMPGKKFSSEAITAAWNFLMGSKKQ